MSNKYSFQFVLVLAGIGLSSCVHKTSNVYSTDTVKVDTIERDNDFPVDTMQVRVDSVAGDSTNKVDSSALVTPIKSEDKK